MLLWFGIIFLIYCFVRGIVQGMVMIQDHDDNSVAFAVGVRSHVWFKHYHSLITIEALLCALSGVMLWTIFPWLNYQMFLILIGISILGWEVFELGYSFARYDVFIPSSENLILLDYDINSELEDKYIKFLHGIRMLLGGLITLIGGLLL